MGRFLFFEICDSETGQSSRGTLLTHEVASIPQIAWLHRLSDSVRFRNRSLTFAALPEVHLRLDFPIGQLVRESLTSVSHLTGHADERLVRRREGPGQA